MSKDGKRVSLGTLMGLITSIPNTATAGAVAAQNAAEAAQAAAEEAAESVTTATEAETKAFLGIS